MREIEPSGDGSKISNMSTSSSSDHICRRSAEGTLERGTEESSALFCLCRHHPFFCIPYWLFPFHHLMKKLHGLNCAGYRKLVLACLVIQYATAQGTKRRRLSHFRLCGYYDILLRNRDGWQRVPSELIVRL